METLDGYNSLEKVGEKSLFSMVRSLGNVGGKGKGKGGRGRDERKAIRKYSISVSQAFYYIASA